MNIIIALFIGGGAGSITRFGMSKLITSNFQHINPVATLISNLVSTLILGVIMYLLAGKQSLTPTLKALLITGFCGGFSTFSTFSYETYEMLRSGQFLFALGNVLISVLLGVGILFFIYQQQHH